MPLTQMQTAYDHFNEHRNTLRMTTGSANLDSLIYKRLSSTCSMAVLERKGADVESKLLEKGKQIETLMKKQEQFEEMIQLDPLSRYNLKRLIVYSSNIPELDKCT